MFPSDGLTLLSVLKNVRLEKRPFLFSGSNTGVRSVNETLYNNGAGSLRRM